MVFLGNICINTLHKGAQDDDDDDDNNNNNNILTYRGLLCEKHGLEGVQEIITKLQNQKLFENVCL
jgi:hypothetical protein